MTVKLAAPLLVAFGLFAQVPADSLTGWGSLTALGIVAIVLVFIVTRMLPQIHLQFAEQAKAFAETISKGQVEFSSTLDRMAERHAAETTPMAHVKGTGPVWSQTLPATLTSRHVRAR